MTNSTSRLSQPVLSYQVGVFALVQRDNDFLLVRPHQLLLPGGPQSLPGRLVPEFGNENDVVENILRSHILQQLGISVGDLRLVGSHSLRGGELSRLPRLNLIFGADYYSGILAPNPEQLKSAMWVPRQQLQQSVPSWLSSALQQMPAPPNLQLEPPQKGLLGFLRVAR